MPVPAIPAVLAVVFGFIAVRGGSMIVRVLASLGISMAFQSFASGPILTFIVLHFAGLPTGVLLAIKIAGIDKAISIILSAVAVKQTFSFIKLRSGT